MAEPPAVVIRTYKPRGQLQLHCLAEPVRFHCVRCVKDMMHSMVATEGGDWTRTVCMGCFGLSRLQAEREKAKQAAIAKRIPIPLARVKSAGSARQVPEQAKQRRTGKVKTEQPRGKAPEPITQKELRQLHDGLLGADRLLAFFRTAGVRAELVRGGRLWINGSQTEPLVKIVKTLNWNIHFIGFPVTIEPTTVHLIEEIALKHVGDKFIKAVEDNARFGEGLRTFLRQRERGFAIMRQDVLLGIIHATHAEIPHREVIHGNFLTPGPHWQQVADVIHAAEPELVAEWNREQEAKGVGEAAVAAAQAKRGRAAARRRVDHLPKGVALELINACLDASRRIRSERQVAYERPVVLECGAGELTLLPITGPGTRLLMPFRLHNATETVTGELLLGDRDPLPLLIGRGVTDEDLIKA